MYIYIYIDALPWKLTTASIENRQEHQPPTAVPSLKVGLPVDEMPGAMWRYEDLSWISLSWHVASNIWMDMWINESI